VLVSVLHAAAERTLDVTAERVAEAAVVAACELIDELVDVV